MILDLPPARRRLLEWDLDPLQCGIDTAAGRQEDFPDPGVVGTIVHRIF